MLTLYSKLFVLIYNCTFQIKSRFGPNLEQLTVSQKVGIMVDSDDQLILFVDEQEQGVAAQNIPPVCYVILDLYGQCEQVRMYGASYSRYSSIVTLVATKLGNA